MTKPEPVTLAAFKDYIDTIVTDGSNEATIAATAFIDGLLPDEFAQAIRYAAEQNVELHFVPDVNEYEPDPQPDEDERKRFNLEATTELFANPIKNHD